MKRSFLLLLTTLLLISAGCSSDSAPAVRHVVLIGTDGFSSAVMREHPEAFQNIEKLMREGSYTLERRSVLPSSSAVNWASMLMGAGPELHGYTTWGSRTPDLPSFTINEYGLFPGIVGLMRDMYPDAEIGCGYTWPVIGCLYEQQAASWNYPATKDQLLADSICLYIRDRKPMFTFIAFDQPDGAGHGFGWESDEYFEECRVIDGYVGRIVDAVAAAGMADETIVIFTSDHGGTGTGHGGITMAEMESPFVICGPGIKQGFHIDESVMVYDYAPTLARIFGLTAPQVWRGRPVDSAFE